MPASEKPIAETRILEGALAALRRGLDELGMPWMVIGGIAVIMRGVRRTTTDIDVAVRGDEVSAAQVLAALKKQEIVGRIPDAEEFAQTTMVLLLRHHPTGVDLDVSFAWSEFEHEALAGCSMARFGKISVPTALAEDLIIYKQIAARPKDLEDVEALKALYPKLSMARVQQRVGELQAMLRESEPPPSPSASNPTRSPSEKKRATSPKRSTAKPRSVAKKK